MDKEQKIMEKRKELENFLREEKITMNDWEMLIKGYIEQKYNESTLQ